ncbi:MAG: hypothetical protein RSB37_02325 [Acetivibrio sp.]
MKEKFAKFMTGRYGVDALTKFMLYIAVGFMILGLIFRNGICNSLAMLLLVFVYFRMFSRNIQKRYSENTKYWNVRNRFLNFFKVRKTSHIYKCPSCKQKIRIPRGKGKIEVICPKCKASFVKRS